MDLSQALQARVQQALAEGHPLSIQGGGGKAFYGLPARGEALEVAGHAGIVEYEPTELVFTARAGTGLALAESVLAAENQRFGFEPPHFGPAATLGGAVAAGLSGPGRPWAGSLRDALLGVRLLNGKGEILAFGGRVMKNVAGFDLSRLQAGALGTLGVLLEVSLRVAPRPEFEQTLVFEQSAAEGLATMNRLAAKPWPLSAACHGGGRLCLRLAGAEAAVVAARRGLGGEVLAEGAAFWADLKEQRLAFFQGPGSLWRISLPPAAPALALPGEWLLDWGGALRWLKSGAAPEAVFAAARQAGGHATLFRRAEGQGAGVFQDLPAELKPLHLRLKRAFDPQGIFNPGRLHGEW